MAGLAAAALLPLCRLPASSSSLTGALADPPGCAGALVHDSRRRAPHAWHAVAPGGAPTLVWSYGNAGNVTGRAPELRMLGARGLGVLVYDYS